VATAVLAACGAWPLATLAQPSTGATRSGAQPSDSARATTGNQPAGQSMSPSTGSTSAAATSASPTDRDFVMSAASGGMLEVEASRLALERAQSTEVRNFAQKMIDDHTRASRDLMAAAASAGITSVPTTLSSKHQAVLNRLRSLKGAEFDREYAEQVGMMAHHETVSLFQREAAEGSNPALKTFASNTLPALRGHLQRSQAVASAAGVPMDRMQAYSPTLDRTTGSSMTATTGATAPATGATTGSSYDRSASGTTGGSVSRTAGSSSRDMTTGQQAGPGWSPSGLVGPYVGGSVGLSNYSDESCFGNCDKTDWGGKIFGGYMFTPWIGAEIDYGWFGKTKINTTSVIGGSTVNSSGEIKTDGFSGFLVGQYPIDNFRPFAKIGFARLNTSVSGSVNGRQLIDNNDPSFEFAWGVGVGWMLDRNFGLRAEYESRRYQFEGNNDNLGFWSVGVQYHF
jgi:putative membrane protein